MDSESDTDSVWILLVAGFFAVLIALLVFHVRTTRLAKRHNVTIGPMINERFWICFCLYLFCIVFTTLWCVLLQLDKPMTLNIWLVPGISFSGIGFAQYCFYYTLTIRVSLPLQPARLEKYRNMKWSAGGLAILTFCTTSYFFIKWLRS